MATYFLICNSGTKAIRWENSSLGGSDYYLVANRVTKALSWQLAADPSPPANLSTLIIDSVTKAISWQNYS